MPLVELGIFKPPAVSQTDSKIQTDPEIQKDSDAGVPPLSPFTPAVSQTEYRRELRRIAHALHEGDLYQLNYTVPFTFQSAPGAGIDPADCARAWYEKLATQSNAPERALLITPEYSVISLSPELFLEMDGAALRTQPMKGTTAPGSEHDLQNPKNRAEHVMIVDLLRNDLGRVCSGVEVERLFSLERYPTFSTLTSTIGGVRKPDCGLREVFGALFPCGSVTGAPKYAAMRAIAELEPHARGAYCGTLGYLLPDGRGRWNVLIRTLQFEHRTGRGRLDLGGGIVADSQAGLEWQELLLKGRLFTALAPFADRGSAPEGN